MKLRQIDRRVIYLAVFLALSWPILSGYTLPPAQMQDAEKSFKVISYLSPGIDHTSPNGQGERYAFVALDFGPNTLAENGPQAEVIIEHLMRRRIPIVLFSQYNQAEPFLRSIPTKLASRLSEEMPGQVWEYGQDWINLGFRPGAALLIQDIPKSKDLLKLFGRDARGTRLTELPRFQHFRTIEDVGLLAQVTGLVGTFASYLQFFKSERYRPTFVHGCTSITIPEAFIYLDSGQIAGLLGGIAGAAYYSALLAKEFPHRAVDDSLILNTGLGIAHLVVIGFILLGNLAPLVNRWLSGSAPTNPPGESSGSQPAEIGGAV